MSRKKYFVILSLLLVTLICAVGAATWVISNPAAFDAAVTDNIKDSKYINLSYRIVEEDGINDELSAAFGELPNDIQLLESDEYEIWFPEVVKEENGVRDNKDYSHNFVGWFVDNTKINSFADIVNLYQKSGEVNFILTARWQAKALVTIVKGMGGYALNGNSGYYMPQTVITVSTTDPYKNDFNITERFYFDGWIITEGDMIDASTGSYTYTVPDDAFGHNITITENRKQKVTLQITLSATATALPMPKVNQVTASATVTASDYGKITDSLSVSCAWNINSVSDQKDMKSIYLKPGQEFKIEIGQDCNIEGEYYGNHILVNTYITAIEGLDIFVKVSNP